VGERRRCVGGVPSTLLALLERLLLGAVLAVLLAGVLAVLLAGVAAGGETVRGGAEGADAASRGGGCSLAAVELLDWRLLLPMLLPLAVAVLELAVRSGGRVGGAGLELGVERVEDAALVVADEAAEAWLSVLRRGSMLLGNGAGERDGPALDGAAAKRVGSLLKLRMWCRARAAAAAECVGVLRPLPPDAASALRSYCIVVVEDAELSASMSGGCECGVKGVLGCTRAARAAGRLCGERGWSASRARRWRKRVRGVGRAGSRRCWREGRPGHAQAAAGFQGRPRAAESIERLEARRQAQRTPTARPRNELAPARRRRAVRLQLAARASIVPRARAREQCGRALQGIAAAARLQQHQRAAAQVQLQHAGGPQRPAPRSTARPQGAPEFLAATPAGCGAKHGWRRAAKAAAAASRYDADMDDEAAAAARARRLRRAR
jgi:hypothetical protein